MNPIDRSTSIDDILWPAPRTFFGAPSVRDVEALDAQVAFLGVPYDAWTIQPMIRTGQSAGPAWARMGSTNHLEYRTTEKTRRLAERGSLVVAVGGDHSISYPVARGMASARRRASRRGPSCIS